MTTTVMWVGAIDCATAPSRLAELLAAIDTASATVVVDLRAVDFLDCAGVGVLTVAHGAAVERGRVLRLEHVPPRVLRLLRVTQVDGLFEAV